MVIVNVVYIVLEHTQKVCKYTKICSQSAVGGYASYYNDMLVTTLIKLLLLSTVIIKKETKLFIFAPSLSQFFLPLVLGLLLSNTKEIDNT